MKKYRGTKKFSNANIYSLAAGTIAIGFGGQKISKSLHRRDNMSQGIILLGLSAITYGIDHKYKKAKFLFPHLWAAWH